MSIYNTSTIFSKFNQSKSKSIWIIIFYAIKPIEKSPPLCNYKYMKLQEIKTFMKRYERIIIPCALIVGFIFDSLTLTRVDKWFDNIILSTYISLTAISIAIIHSRKNSFTEKRWFLKLQAFAPLIISYALGGLFSGLFIFYSRSGTIYTSFPFLFALLVLFIGNDYIQTKYKQVNFQLLIFYVAIFSYSILITPIITGKMNTYIFLLGTIVSILLIILYIRLLSFVIDESFIKIRKSIYKIISFIASVFVLFYFLNIIPPIPLSLKDGAIAHNVQREPNLGYKVTVEKAKWYRPFKDYDKVFHYKKGEGIYAFSSVFAPTKIQGKIYHKWSYFDSKKIRWVETDVIPINISGGSDGGSRGYSIKQTVWDGDWRVDITSEKGQVIGRLKFTVDTEGVPSDFLTSYR